MIGAGPMAAEIGRPLPRPFADGDDVGRQIVDQTVGFVRVEGAGATDPDLDLVAQNERACRAATANHVGEEPGRWDEQTAVGHDRFDQQDGRVLGQGGVERGE